MKVIAIALVCLAQICVPAVMIYTYEDTLRQGTSYRFKVRPVDPADPFRGRFVRLTFEQEIISDSWNSPPGVETLPDGWHSAYAIIGVDDDGLAKVTALANNPPKNQSYVKVKTRKHGSHLYSLDFPFDRYYAEESKAPNIENVVQRRLDESQLITAQVHIKNGVGVISELYVGDRTIHDYLNDQASD